MKPFRVIQIGFGSLGQHISRTILKRNNLELVAIVDANPDLIGKPLDQLLQDDISSEISVAEDLKTVLKAVPADIAIVATASSLKAVVPTLCVQLDMLQCV